MRRRRFLRVAGAGSVPLLAGCSGDSEPPDETTVSVEAAGNQPRQVRVAAGGTVTWRNEDSRVGPLNDHTVTSARFHDVAADWSFDEELTESGQEVSYTFDAAGVYQYYDRNEGKTARCGVVLVGDAEFSEPLPCSAVS